jgi:hypothetical protein
MVLHRPVELAQVIGKFEFGREIVVAEYPVF